MLLRSVNCSCWKAVIITCDCDCSWTASSPELVREHSITFWYMSFLPRFPISSADFFDSFPFMVQTHLERQVGNLDSFLCVLGMGNGCDKSMCYPTRTSAMCLQTISKGDQYISCFILPPVFLCHLRDRGAPPAEFAEY